MDYEFEAPQYFNFANAMDEDDHDVSSYFDTEHEHDFKDFRVKVNPLDILPKGARTFSTTSQPNRGGSLQNSKSTRQTLQGQESNPSQSPVSTPPRRFTRSSLKGTPVNSSPSAQYADCLTPGVKRLRSSKDNTPDGTPSKRLKSTPGRVLQALANIQLSPAPETVDQSLQEAIPILGETNRPAKSPATSDLSIKALTTIASEHPMATKTVNSQPLHLRSRSVPRSQPSASPAKLDRKVRARALSTSKDVAIPSVKTNEENRYVSLSDVLNQLHTKSPTRFRIKKNSPSKLTNGPMKPLKATAPLTTDVQTRFRSRTRSVETSTRNTKVNGTPSNVLKPLNSIEKRTPTVPAPFKLTEVRKKETPRRAEPFKFTARPAPKSVLEPKKGCTPSRGVSPSKGVTPIKGKTPSKGQTPRKFATVVHETNDERCLKEKDITFLNGMTLVLTNHLTEPKPFSFEVRENERLARKNARLQEKIEAELRGRPQFHANPLPVFHTPRNLKRSPSPFSRKAVNGSSTSSTAGSTSGSIKQSTVPETKAPLAPNFKARAPVVLAKKPFEPVKPQRQLPLPDFTLKSEVRAKDRHDYDKKRAEKEAELQALAKKLREERERREEEARAKLRRQIVHKARPVPELRAFEPQPSGKPLTEPKTPNCFKRSSAKR